MFRFLLFIVFIFWAYNVVTPATAVRPVSDSTPVVVQPEKPKVYDEEGCNIDTDAHLVAEHEVGQIINLEEERFEFGMKNECSVNYDIVVDGQTHHVEQTESGLEQMNSICYYARENGRKNLLLNLPGKFNSHANIECRYKDTIGKSDS
jgi:hypothetical protein